MRQDPSLRTTIRLGLGLFALIATSSVFAFGALGADVSSIQSDQAHLAASARIVPNGSYSVYVMKTASGTAIRQFVSPDGKVFAVSWQGAAPNLEQLMGDYFESFVASAKARTARRGRGIHVETGDLVVESGGHMRFVVGRAYLRGKLPQGVTADEIR